jgi:hypothetical protein
MGIPSATATVAGASVQAVSTGVGYVLHTPAAVGGAIASLWASPSERDVEAFDAEKVVEEKEQDAKAEEVLSKEIKDPGESNKEAPSSNGNILSYLNPLSYAVNPLGFFSGKSEKKADEAQAEPKMMNTEDTICEESSESSDDLEDTEILESRKSAELLPVEPDSDWTPWINLGLTTAAMAGGAYYFGGSLIAMSTVTVVKRIALAYAVSHAEDARQRLRFLYPIWGESREDQEARFKAMKEESESERVFMFKNYYQRVAETSEETKEVLYRSFIVLPESSQYLPLFEPVGTDSANEIAGHTNMFSRNENPGHYWDSIHRTSLDIKRIVKKFKDIKKSRLLPIYVE